VPAEDFCARNHCTGPPSRDVHKILSAMLANAKTRRLETLAISAVFLFSFTARTLVPTLVNPPGLLHPSQRAVPDRTRKSNQGGL